MFFRLALISELVRNALLLIFYQIYYQFNSECIRVAPSIPQLPAARLYSTAFLGSTNFELNNIYLGEHKVKPGKW
jgi:hypothetical protein